MKKILVFIATAIFVLLLGIGGYFLGRSMDLFMTDQEVLQKSFTQIMDLESFEIGANIVLPEEAGQLRLRLKQIMPQQGVLAANDLILEMKSDSLAEMGVENGEMELFSMRYKEDRTYIKLGEFPVLTMFGLGDLLGEWFYLDVQEFEELQNELFSDGQGSLAMLGFSQEEFNLEDFQKEKDEIFSFISDYFFNKNLLIVDEKLANTDINGQTMQNYSLKLDEELFKEFVLELAILINGEEDAEKIASYREELETEVLPINFENIKVAIAKSNLTLQALDFDLLLVEGEDSVALPVSMTFSNMNRLSADDIEKPEAYPVISYLKYLSEETERASDYAQREYLLEDISEKLAVKCEEFQKIEEEEQAEIDVLPEEVRANRKVTNRVLAIDGKELALVSKLEKTESFDPADWFEPSMGEEILEACLPNSTAPCDFAFGNPSKSGEAFGQLMTYVDPCDYWINFYTDSGMIGHISPNEKAYPVYKERSFEDYQAGILPETSYSSEALSALEYNPNTYIGGFIDPMANSSAAEEARDARRKADMAAIRTALALSCIDGDEIILDTDSFTGAYLPISYASGSSYISFANITDPLGDINACVNDADDNCNYAYADPDNNGEFLPLDLNEENQVLLDPCHYRINFYLDGSGAAYANEAGLFQADGEILR